MARGLAKLSALKVKQLNAPGRYCDGGGLYLQVGPQGGKSWLFRYTRNGKAREMGLGALDTLSLAEARTKAAEARQVLAEGGDPIEAREAERVRARIAETQGLSFAECAKAYIQAHKVGWRNAKHAAQWTSTLKTYAEPVMGDLPVQSVDLGMVVKVLEPIWHSKPETASRVRGRIEAILDWAAVRGYRSGDNPARWKGHLDKLFPPRSKVRRVKHHDALPYDDIPSFMADLRGREGVAARALEFTILTATRTSEALNAQWEEFDFDALVWTIPGERMKAGREHRIPLTPAMERILGAMANVRRGPFVFPGNRQERPLSNMVFLQLLRRMERSGLTAHGFRSTFRDWAAERTNFAREVAEAALAHTIGDKVESAYRRGDLFQKRRKLMEAWSDYCQRPSQKSVILPLRAKSEA